MESSQLAQWLRSSRDGDRESFGRLVSAYQGRVCSVAYALTGNVQLSEDLAQEAFVAAWRELKELRELEKFPSWVCGIARNLARKALRRREQDALDQSQPLTVEPAATAEAVSDTLDRQETEAVVWETLETIPEIYREPLVMFYREAGSVRSIAESLDISEDTTRQRLSRGRQMLKAKVAALVESALEHTRPTAAFTIAVLAALPAAASQAMAAGAATSVAGKAATAGGTPAVVATGAMAGILGGLLGTLIGMSGGFFGMWASIRNSPTLRTRRYSLKMCGVVYAFVWVFLGLQGVGMAIFWHNPEAGVAWRGVCWVGYVPLLIAMILKGNRTYRRILLEDRVASTGPAIPLEESSLSRKNVRRVCRWSLLVAVVASAGSLAWIVSIPNGHRLWLPALGVLFLCHVLYVEVLRRGLHAAYDQAAFETIPPLFRDRAEMGLNSGSGFVYRSKTMVLGIPLISIGSEIDQRTGEEGPCRGIIAIGSRPLGVLAIGGMPFGIVSIGGLACGVFSLGGVAIGVVSLGGAAFALVAAIGGLAIGGVAVGGAAVGYYAFGGGVCGVHTISGAGREPEAIEFFGRWFPGLLDRISPRP